MHHQGPARLPYEGRLLRYRTGTDPGRGRWPDQVNGIEIQAFNVIVDGFTVLNAKSPEIQINGNNVTLRNTVARNPIRPGSDNIQLTGDNITISHNTLGEDSGDGGRPNGGGTKANCIDTSSPTIAIHGRVTTRGSRATGVKTPPSTAYGHSAANPPAAAEAETPPAISPSPTTTAKPGVAQRSPRTTCKTSRSPATRSPSSTMRKSAPIST
jgi:hypothetical protein